MTLSKTGPQYDLSRSTSTPKMSLIYIGFVKDNKDTQNMGRLSVWIPEIGGDPANPASWTTVSYASPFAGATDYTKLKDNQTMDGSQTSYGWWGIPPDLNNEVVVFFANGDPARGYWFACTYQQNMNYMVPGIAVGKTTDGKTTPVIEYNKLNVGSVASPMRPTFTPLTDGLKAEGLTDDKERGQATTSARREAPSKVFGYITPRSNTIHIDDNEQNEFIRLRTRSGTQVLIDETTGFVYINSKKGNAWIEISDECVDIYSKTTVSIRAETDVNIRADQNIILDAGKDINIRAGNNITMECGKDMQIKVGHDYNLSIKENGNISVGKKLNLKTTDDLNLESGKNFNTKTKGKFSRDASGGIYDNSGGAEGAGSGGGSSPSGNAPSGSQNKVVQAAESQIGKNGADANAFLHANGQSMDASRNNWCAEYVNASLSSAGIQGSGSNVATSFMNWGSQPTDGAQAGDVLVEGRGLSAGQVGGHVGIATGETRDVNGITQYRMVSSNATGNGQVAYNWMNASSVSVRRAPSATQTLIEGSILQIPRPKITAGIVPYNGSNVGQQKLLAGLVQGEVGGRTDAIMLGTGNVDLTGKPTFANGFPIWDGTGNSHAAGPFQFQPGTWAPIADKYNLNFQNGADQMQGAWYNAQQVYARNNNGASLQEALDRGTPEDLANVQKSLSKEWTSVNGNAANPEGLAAYMAGGSTNPELQSAMGATNDVFTKPDDAVVPDAKDLPDNSAGSKDGKTKTIVSRMPTHEPWPLHPKPPSSSPSSSAPPSGSTPSLPSTQTAQASRSLLGTLRQRKI